MKKLLSLIVAIAAIAAVGADQYAYKMSGGKVGKLKVITSEQSAEYQSQGYTVTADKLAVYNLLVSTGQEAAAIQKGIVPTPQEKILTQSKFAKLDIRRAMRAIEVAGQLYGEKTTQEATLDALLNSNASFKADWNDATEINLNDPLVIQALGAVSIDVNAIKLKILELQK